MYLMVKTEVSNWLDRKFLDWQYQQGGTRTLLEFADYLGIKQSTLSHYLSGRRMPNEAAAHLIAAKLGDEIYDLLGMQRPDPMLREMTKHWDQLSDEQQKRLLEYARELRLAREGADVEIKESVETGS